jgi:hypothetical protein
VHWSRILKDHLCLKMSKNARMTCKILKPKISKDLYQ